MQDKQVDRFSFNLSSMLGEGSFGKVYKGKDNSNNMEVAIKMIPKSIINEDDYLKEGLFSEIKVMQKLKSPNVVSLIDVLETANNFYIIQEYCDSGDLSGFLKKQGCMTEEEAIQLYKDVLTGFLELIKNGIIHRDLKPANILINKGIYKLADFGFAKCVNNFGKQMFVSAVGTPLYMSPQILKNEKYSSKSDIWSLGMVFYEALYGKTPYLARSIPELIKKINKYPVEFDNNRPVSQYLKDFLLGCLQPEEEKRLSWDQIYRSPIFGNYFQFYIKESQQLEDKANYLINDLRTKVLQDRIDIEELFTELDYRGNQSLSDQELSKLLLRIDSTLSKEEIKYIFNKFDDDGNGQVEFDEFRKWLEVNQVRMSFRQRGNFQKQNSIDFPNNNSQVQTQVPNTQFTSLPQTFQSPQQPFKTEKQIGEETVRKLCEAIKQYKVNVHTLYTTYDQSKQQKLTQNDLGKMLRKVDPTIKDEEIQCAFKLLDQHSQNFISYQQFEYGLIFQQQSMMGSDQNNQQYGWGYGPQQQPQVQQQPQFQQQPYNNYYPPQYNYGQISSPAPFSQQQPQTYNPSQTQAGYNLYQQNSNMWYNNTNANKPYGK